MSAPGSDPGHHAAPASPTHVIPGDPGTPAWRSARAWLVLLVCAAVFLAIDLASKRLAFARIADAPVRIDRADVLALPPSRINDLVPRHEPVVVAPSVLELKLVLNPGAVFGMGPGKQGFFIVFTGVALAFGVYMFAAWTRAREHTAHVALALIIAGGVGNLYDRVVHGCVRDFLHPLPGVLMPFGLSWPGGERQLWPYVSNIADAMLLIGIAALLVMMWRGEPKRRPPATP